MGGGFQGLFSLVELARIHVSGANFGEEGSFVGLLAAFSLGHAGEGALIHLDGGVELAELNVEIRGFSDCIEEAKICAFEGGFGFLESECVLAEREFVFVGLSGFARSFTIFFPIFSSRGRRGGADEDQDGEGEKTSREELEAGDRIHCERES